MKKLTFIILAIIVLGSCTSRKEIVYFQDIDDRDLEKTESLSKQLEINTNDILNINVRTLNPQAALQFNPQSTPGQGNQNMRVEMLKVTGYLVKSDGTIDFPELGSINVRKKTTQEVQNMLEEKLKQFLKNPIVSVRVINYKFTILGEVKAPGTYEIVEENFTLLQALGRAGGLTINGMRDNVLIIRHQDGDRITKRIDLTSSEWMNSPYYFIKQNDQIYVEPNNPQVKRAGFIGNASTVLSALSVILSAIVIIFR